MGMWGIVASLVGGLVVTIARSRRVSGRHAEAGGIRGWAGRTGGVRIFEHATWTVYEQVGVANLVMKKAHRPHCFSAFSVQSKCARGNRQCFSCDKSFASSSNQCQPSTFRHGSSCDEGRCHEEGCSRHVEEWHRSGDCHGDVSEAGRRQECARQLGNSGHQGGEEEWSARMCSGHRVDVRGPWIVRLYDFDFEYKLQNKTKFEMRGRRLGSVTLGHPP